MRIGRGGAAFGIVAAALVAGCAGQPETLSMQGTAGQAEAITFPNGTVFGGASAKEAGSLAQIAVDANNNNMKEFAAVRAGQARDTAALQAGQAAESRQIAAAQQAAEHEAAALRALGSKELQTSQKAVRMLEQLSAQQGTGQITLFFPTGSASIPPKSLQYDRLVNFLDYLSRQSRGRKLLFVMIGSASAIGNMEINQRLSAERADAPRPVIDQYLVNVPHEFYKVAGVGDAYSPKDASLSVDQRYQNVRIIAVYQTDQVPALPEDIKR
jgi:outer membrane protein OmpA-like peptidoglycan-associated protein